MEVDINLVLVPVIIGIVQAIKMAGLPSRWAAVLSILLGIVGAFLFDVTLIAGIIYGLSAAGLYSGTKATVAPMLGTKSW